MSIVCGPAPKNASVEHRLERLERIERTRAYMEERRIPNIIRMSIGIIGSLLLIALYGYCMFLLWSK